MKPLKEHISISLDSDVIAQVRILAEGDDRSFSSYVNLILRKHLESKKPQEKPPRQT